MGSGGMLPARDPPARAGSEIVHESERTRVTRLFLPGRAVLRKEPLGADAERRVRHEAGMLERLRGVNGLAQLAEDVRYPGSVVLEDAGTASLAGQAGPLAAPDLTGHGLGLARAVAGMHRRGVMHRDITPANIVVSDDGSPCLVDFALAASAAEIRPEFTPPRRDHRDAGVPGAGADRAADGRAGRPVRPRRGAVRAGHRAAAVRHRGPAAAHPRSPGPGAGAAGPGKPGRAGTAVRDHHAPAGEGTGQPLPDGRRPGL